MEVRRVRIDQLRQDPGNVRLHDARNIATIAASLKEFSQVEPLIVQKGTGKVIAGNGRLKALREMGVTECDVVEVEADDARAAALSIPLNRSAELASWDEAALASALQALDDEGFDLDTLGFSSKELDELLEPGDPEVKDLKVEPPPPKMAWVLIGIPTVRFGDIAGTVEELALLPDTIVESVLNDG